MKKKVLILGGAGFIGLGIARFLGENRDYDITIADIFSPGQKDSDLNQVVSESPSRAGLRLFSGSSCGAAQWLPWRGSLSRPWCQR